MAHVVIDGYNLLPATTYRDREALIAALARYRKLKNHEVTVVFDGGKGGTRTGDRSFSSGIEVVYSPITVTADTVIEEMLPDFEGSSTIVVSSDWRIQTAAKREKMVFLESREFARRLTEAAKLPLGTAPPPWMEGREDDDKVATAKKCPGRKLSKEARRKKRSLRQL
ncbi:MAG: NYN domain-containing protein [Pseudomonadota bacterium]